MEPDLSLLERKRSNLVPILLVVTLCVLGIVALVVSPPRKPRKLPPAPPAQPAAARAPLYVTVVPVDDEGWCCTAGQLSAATRARCTAAIGTFFADQAEGKKSCPTARSGSPRGRGTGT
jgi:hypothetical protein